MNSNDAMAFAIRAAGPNRLDKGGNPYVGHLMQACVYLREQLIVEGMDPNDDIAMQAAILHDTVEDTPTTLDDLAAAGFDPKVVDLVRVLTRKGGQDYIGYLLDIVDHSRLAVLIKVADARSNVDPTRLKPGAKTHTIRKYIFAIELLLADDPAEMTGATMNLTAVLAADGHMSELEGIRASMRAVHALAKTDGVTLDQAQLGAVAEASEIRERGDAIYAKLLAGQRP
jgi:(p)ppGpp synthase/HD superfamily hydrolase